MNMATADKITTIVEKTEIVLKLTPDEAQALRSVLGSSQSSVLTHAGLIPIYDALAPHTGYGEGGFRVEAV